MQVLLQERLSGRASPMFTGRIAGSRRRGSADLLRETRARDMASCITPRDNLSASGQFAGSCRRPL